MKLEKLIKSIIAAGLIIGCTGSQGIWRDGEPHDNTWREGSIKDPLFPHTSSAKPAVIKTGPEQKSAIYIGTASELQEFVRKHGWGNVQYLERINVLSEQIRQNPKNDDLLFYRAYSYQIIDMYQEAIADYDVVLKIDSSLGNVYYNRGLAKKALGLYREAISDFQKCSTGRKDDSANSQIRACEELADKKTRPTSKDKPRQNKKDGCYITTACVQAANMADDCLELQALRNFRDDYLSGLPFGRDLISIYYNTAPRILHNIQSQKNSREILCRIFDREIIAAVNLIQKGDFERALQHYITMACRLSGEF